MTLSRKNTRAFTIIELLIVIVVIGILSAIGIMSYSKVQQSSRDAKRSSSISTIAEALENYYQKNGEYPSCTMMSSDSDYVSKTVLSGNIAKDVLSTPTTTSGTNSIQAACADLNASSSDLFSYIGDNSTNCTTGTSCSNYVLKYKEENTGNIITVKSRYGNEKSFAVTWGGSNNDHANSVANTSDGGYVITGTQYSFSLGVTDGFLAKFNSDGVLIWSKTWGSTGQDSSNSVIQTDDGGYFTAGDIIHSGNLVALLNKFNGNGEIEWSRILNEATASTIDKVIQTSDGNYAITGTTNAYGVSGFDMFTAKYDRSGNMIWIKTIGGSGYDRGSSLAQSDNGDIIVAGLTSSYGTGPYEAFIVKYSSKGDFIWNKTWGGAGDDKAEDIAISPDGYIITGQTSSFGSGNYDTLVTKFDTNGNLLWSKVWGGSATEYTYGSILTDNNKSILVVGDTQSFSSNSDAFVIKLDTNGNLLSSKTWSGISTERFYGIDVTTDGGFLAIGNVYSYGAGGGDALLIKYKPNGSILNCPDLNCKNQSISTISPTATITSPSATKRSPTVRTDSLTVVINSTNSPVSRIIYSL